MTAQSPIPQDQMAARLATARRTALLFAAIAFAVYAGFILLNAVAK